MKKQAIFLTTTLVFFTALHTGLAAIATLLGGLKQIVVLTSISYSSGLSSTLTQAAIEQYFLTFTE